MSVLRSSQLKEIDTLFCQATLDWHHEAESTGLDWYLLKHGVFHLLSQGQVEQAKQRMLDIHFMADFATAYETVVEPWKAFRVVGVDEMRTAFSKICSNLNKMTHTHIPLSSLNVVSRLLQDIGYFNVAIELLLFLLDTLKNREMNNKIEIVDVMNKLSDLYQSTGDFSKAQEVVHEVIELCNKSKVELSASLLVAKNTLGEIYFQLGNYLEAKNIFKELISIRKETLGLFDLDTAVSLNNLSVVYTAMSVSHFQKSLDLIKEVVKIKTQILGKFHPSTIRSVSNMAVTYWKLKEYDTALSNLEMVLEFRTQVFGMNHPDTILSLNNLGVFYWRTGNYEKGEEYLSLMIQLSEKVLGERHFQTLNTCGSLGRLYIEIEEFLMGEMLLKRVVDGYEIIYGLEDDRTLMFVDELAWVLLDQHKTEGNPLFLRLLKSWSDPTDWKHHWARLGLELSDALVSGDFTFAESTLQDLRKTLGQDHDRVAKGQDKMDKARAYVQQNT